MKAGRRWTEDDYAWQRNQDMNRLERVEEQVRYIPVLSNDIAFILGRIKERTQLRSDISFCDMTNGVHHNDCRWCAMLAKYTK